MALTASSPLTRPASGHASRSRRRTSYWSINAASMEFTDPSQDTSPMSTGEAVSVAVAVACRVAVAPGVLVASGVLGLLARRSAP